MRRWLPAALFVALASCGAPPKQDASQGKPADGGGQGSDQKGGKDQGDKGADQKDDKDQGGGQKDDKDQAGGKGGQKDSKGQGGGKGDDDKGGDKTPKDPRAKTRYPQPVLAGALAGRWLIAPEESQPVLGTVEGVVRDPKDGEQLVVRTGGVAGVKARLVLVSADEAALLNQKVALVDEDVDDFRKSPAYKDGSLPPVKPQETIRMGIVKPFH